MKVVFADLVDLTRDFTVVATNNLGKVVNIPKDELPLVGRTAAGNDQIFERLFRPARTGIGGCS